MIKRCLTLQQHADKGEGGEQRPHKPGDVVQLNTRTSKQLYSYRLNKDGGVSFKKTGTVNELELLLVVSVERVPLPPPSRGFFNMCPVLSPGQLGALPSELLTKCVNSLVRA